MQTDDTHGRCDSDARPPCVVRHALATGATSGARRKRDLPGIGARFGELTVTGYRLGERGGVTGIEVQCSCGANPHFASLYNLIAGRTTRCNPCAKKQTYYWHKRYKSYADVVEDESHRARLLNRISSCLARCHNPRNKQFHHYGGRGIHVYEPWRTDRRAFLRYLLTLPGWDTPEFELDRADVNRGYEPGNLRFVSRSENMSNRRKVTLMQAEIAALRSRVAELEQTVRLLRDSLL